MPSTAKDALPPLKATVAHSYSCLTLTVGSDVGEFFTDDQGKVDLWQLDEFISKLIAKEADKQHLRNELSGK